MRKLFFALLALVLVAPQAQAQRLKTRVKTLEERVEELSQKDKAKEKLLDEVVGVVETVKDDLSDYKKKNDARVGTLESRVKKLEEKPAGIVVNNHITQTLNTSAITPPSKAPPERIYVPVPYYPSPRWRQVWDPYWECWVWVRN